MHKHSVTTADLELKEQFEKCLIAPSEFGHEPHVRLAYVYLCEEEPDPAFLRMRESLLKFIAHHGIDPMKYHETLTRAWMMAVDHFMLQAPPMASATDFVAAYPQLLDSKIMLGHYRRETLFSERARASFVEGDLDPIPH